MCAIVRLHRPLWFIASGQQPAFVGCGCVWGGAEHVIGPDWQSAHESGVSSFSLQRCTSACQRCGCAPATHPSTRNHVAPRLVLERPQLPRYARRPAWWHRSAPLARACATSQQEHAEAADRRRQSEREADAHGAGTSGQCARDARGHAQAFMGKTPRFFSSAWTTLARRRCCTCSRTTGSRSCRPPSTPVRSLRTRPAAVAALAYLRIRSFGWPRSTVGATLR